MKVLDVGCGTCKFEGAVGVDCIELDGVDVVTNLNQFPWPFESNTFERVIFKHSISHFVNIVDVMEEVSRISKNGAIIDIIAPHYTSDNFNTDPTHKFPMGYRSMYYFCTNIENWKYKYSKADFKLIDSGICFGEYDIDFNKYEFSKRKSILKMIGFEFLVNKIPRVYEKFLAYTIPASVVFFKLEVTK
jgi:ubiquinone/menaquinone biosynthesis C-methylase UbiE